LNRGFIFSLHSAKYNCFDPSGGGSVWNVVRFRRGFDARSIPRSEFPASIPAPAAPYSPNWPRSCAVLFSKVILSQVEVEAALRFTCVAELVLMPPNWCRLRTFQNTPAITGRCLTESHLTRQQFGAKNAENRPRAAASLSRSQSQLPKPFYI